MIVFTCGACGATLKVADDKAGRQGKCPKCGGPLVVPRLQMPPSADLPAADQAVSSPETTVRQLPPDGTLPPTNGSARPARKAIIRIAIGLGVIVLLIAAYLVWSAMTSPRYAIQGVFRMAQQDDQNPGSPVCVFRPDGYVTVYSFVDRNNLLLLFDGDIPMRGLGVIDLPRRDGEVTADVFRLKVEGKTFLFIETNAGELLSMLKDVTTYFDMRKINKDEGWHLIDPNLRHVVGERK
jgi:DNA-directed RNA polymerase subunit RPC12/RpoP